MSFEKDSLDLQEDEEELTGEVETDTDNDEECITQDSQEYFSCKYCEFQTSNVDELDEHIVTHEEAILEDLDEEEEEETPQTQRGPQPQFSISRTSNNLSTGKKIKQELPAFYEEFAGKRNKKVFVCPYCGYQSMKKLDMNRHLKEHRRPVEVPIYACAECSYTTRRKCDMPKHLLTHCKNGSVPMYKCTHCPYATKRKGDLSKHLLCHTKPTVKMYSCNECPYVSKWNGDLKKHLLCHENGGTATIKEQVLLNCTECGYTSKRLNDLHKHAALHCDRSVKKFFKCTKCDYASAAGSPFAKHVLSHCQFREMAVSIFPKDNLMQEYIVLEEDDLHLYQLEKNNVQVVNAEGVLKRKASNERHNYSKRANLDSFYVPVQTDLQQLDTDADAENSKVVVINCSV